MTSKATATPDPGYLTELKDLVLLHARAQGIAPRRCAAVLDRIERDGGGPGGWVDVWTGEAARFATRGDHLTASRYYNLARFPYVDGAARATARRFGVTSFSRWASRRGIRRLDVPVDGSSVGAWVSRPGAVGRPLLLILGGIVSTKEQWGPLLTLDRRLGMAVAAAEMPGVGENRLRYERASWEMLPALLDRLSGTVDVAETYLLALSFGGHLAMRAAVHDARIRGIATVGAPVSAFFRDRSWWETMPETTVRTLSHLTRVEPERLPKHLDDWALTTDELSALRIPVHYVASTRDEIVPPADVAMVRDHVGAANVVEHDDVHGSPNHVLHTRLWIAQSVLSMRGGARLRRGLLGSALNVLGTGRRSRA